MQYFDDDIKSIYFAETREYFCVDVVPAFNNGSFRSCIISLWNILLYDLEKKIDYIVESGNIGGGREPKLKALLTEFEEIRQGKKLGQDLDLIQKVVDQTSLISKYELESTIRTLKAERNLCAHPIVETGLVYNTNPHVVRGLIEQTLKILKKLPFDYKSHFDNIMIDIKALSYYNNENMEVINVTDFTKSEFRYLYNKYYRHFDGKDIEKFFLTLFKFVFVSTDPECVKNRNINFVALLHFTYQYKKELASYIDTNKEVLVDLVDKINEEKVYSLFALYVLRFIDLFLCLNTVEKFSTCIEIKQNNSEDFIVVKEVIVNNKIFLGNFGNKNNSLYYTYGDDQNNPVSLSALLLFQVEKYYIDNGYPKISDKINELCIRYYSCSGSYNTADKRFEEYIQPRLNAKKFDKTDIAKLAQCCNDNSQTWGRSRASIDHESIANYLKSEEFNLTEEELSRATNNSFFTRRYKPDPTYQ